MVGRCKHLKQSRTARSGILRCLQSNPVGRGLLRNHGGFRQRLLVHTNDRGDSLGCSPVNMNIASKNHQLSRTSKESSSVGSWSASTVNTIGICSPVTTRCSSRSVKPLHQVLPMRLITICKHPTKTASIYWFATTQDNRSR